MRCKKDYKDPDKYRNYRNHFKAGYRKRTGSFMYKPREWTIDELRMVEAHDIPDRELSKKIERSVSAIQTIRSKIKRGYYNI